MASHKSFTILVSLLSSITGTGKIKFSQAAYSKGWPCDLILVDKMQIGVPGQDLQESFYETRVCLLHWDFCCLLILPAWSVDMLPGGAANRP